MNKMLTQKQRHAIYKKALRKYIKEINYLKKGATTLLGGLRWFMLGGLCYYLGEAKKSRVFEEDIEQFFPEIWKHKPKGQMLTAYWWGRSQTEERIAVLKSAIEETAPEQK